MNTQIDSHKPIVYYVTAHGHGHSVRTCDVILKLRELHPEIPVILRTAMSPDFFRKRLHGCSCRTEPAAFDVGLVQFDSVEADLEESYRRLADLLHRRPDAIIAEARWLEETQAGLVVVDIPGIPIAAAAAAGIPSIAVANFSWDWIYSEFAERDRRWAPIVSAFAEDYSKADLLIQLPFSAPMEAFSRKVDVGLLAEPGRDRRGEIAEALGLDINRRWVLLSFSSIILSKEAIDNIGELRDYEFLAMPELKCYPANIHHLSDDDFPFSDIVASCDCVLTKPGYGIISDCIANGKPLVHAERKDFREYEVLLGNINRYLKHAQLSMKELYSGRLARALAEIERTPAPTENVARNGSESIVLNMIQNLQ